MVLDISCMRDILFCLEGWSFLTDDLEYQYMDLNDLEKCPALKDYAKSQIAYTVLKLKEADFIHASVIAGGDCITNIFISSITFDGHQFIDTIRPESVWKKIRAICEKTGLKSVAVIMDIADIILPREIKSVLHN